MQNPLLPLGLDGAVETNVSIVRDSNPEVLGSNPIIGLYNFKYGLK
jgi:hypothetical protein